MCQVKYRLCCVHVYRLKEPVLAGGLQLLSIKHWNVFSLLRMVWLLPKPSSEISEQSQVSVRDSSGNRAHLMMHLLGLALCLLHLIITDFQLRYKSLISLWSHSFLAVRGQWFACRRPFRERAGGTRGLAQLPGETSDTFCGNLNLITRKQVVWIRYCVYFGAG